MTSRLLVVLCFFLSLVITSCSKKPSSLLSRQKMIDVLIDVQMAASLSEAYNVLPIEYKNSEEYKRRIMEGVYKKHNITKAILDSSLVWYSENLNEYNTINDSVIVYLRGTVKTLREDQAYLKSSRYGNKQYALLMQSYLNSTRPLITMNIEKPELEKLDKSLLGIGFGILGMNRTDSLQADFRFKYRDTTIINSFNILKDSVFYIVKPELADSLLDDVSGYIRLLSNKYRVDPILVYNLHYIDSTLSKTSAVDSLKAPKTIDLKLEEDSI